MLIVLAHFLFTKQYNFRIVNADAETIEGKEDPQPATLRQLASSNDKRSELLPEDWNQDAQKYALHYMDDANQRYVLLAKLTRNDLVINLQNSTSKRMSITCLQPKSLVCCIHSPSISHTIPDAKSILMQLRRDLVDPVVHGIRKPNPITYPNQSQTIGEDETDNKSESLYSLRESDAEPEQSKSNTTMAVYKSLKSVTSLDSV
ncbi:uncharacterized protein Dwil_GK25729 [Drosophila willistoni]|uniref:PI31 proteasome regulator N-terminal domain-containing protein n=2 Tax=Drosophila willistoni TaxID=7260 RepID=B4NBV0_DROWI|nr:uncharacterized protein Dwil_GK25729 [Drosophila willistoni]